VEEDQKDWGGKAGERRRGTRGPLGSGLPDDDDDETTTTTRRRLRRRRRGVLTNAEIEPTYGSARVSRGPQMDR
jgi:hypothetical protein